MDDIGRLNGPVTDRSGTASTTSTKIISANSHRKYLYIQNNDATNDIYVNFGAAATSAHFKIAKGGGSQSWAYGQFCPTDDVFAISSAGTPAFMAKEG